MATETALILVVDDNEMNRDMLVRRLQKQGYEVLAVEDGLAALEIVQKYRFDLILLDIMMPNLSGYEVLERLKANLQTAYLPVIMISAVDDLDSVVKCIEMGAEDYLFKPFNPVLLKARVGSILSRRRSNASNMIQQVQAHMGYLKETLVSLSEGKLGALNDAQNQALQDVLARLESLEQSIF